MKTGCQIIIVTLAVLLIGCAASLQKTISHKSNAQFQMDQIQTKMKNGIIKVDKSNGRCIDSAYVMSGTKDLTEASVASQLILSEKYGNFMETWTIDSLQLKKIDKKTIWIVVLKDSTKHYFDLSQVLKEKD